MNDLIGALAKDVDVLLSDLLADLDIRTVHRTKGQRTVEHKLHVAGTRCFLGGKADLFGQIARRNQLFCCRHIVILNKHYLQPWGNLWILCNDSG